MNANAPLAGLLRRAAAPACLLLAVACSKDGGGAPAAAAAGQAAPAAKPAAAPTDKPAAPDDRAVRAPGEGDVPPRTNDVFVLEPSSLKLGILEPNEERQVDFKVKNLSAQPLKIETIKTGCKCLTLQYEKKPIPVGGAGAVHVKVTGVTRESRRISVTVTTDDPKRSVAELAVYYSIVPAVDCNPPKADFGKAKVGEPAEQLIKVTLHLPPELEKVPALEPFITPDLPIKLVLDPPTVTQDGNFRDVVTTLHLVLDTSRPLPAFQAQLVFKPKEPKTFRFTSIPVFGEVRASIFFEHDKLVFTGVEAGKPATKSIRLYFTGEKAPELTDVAIAPGEFTEKHELEAEKHCIRFDVTCTPKAGGALTGELRAKVAGVADPLAVALTARGK